MPFIGKQQAVGFTTTTKQDLTPDGSTVAFSLNKPAASANDIEVFVGNVRQEPTDAYTVSGTTLTMSAAPASGLNFYVLFKEANQSATVPAAGTSVPGEFNVQGDFNVSSGKTFIGDGLSGVSKNTHTSDNINLHIMDTKEYASGNADTYQDDLVNNNIIHDASNVVIEDGSPHITLLGKKASSYAGVIEFANGTDGEMQGTIIYDSNNENMYFGVANNIQSLSYESPSLSLHSGPTPNYGATVIYQTPGGDDSDNDGLAIFSDGGTRTTRIWNNNNDSYLYGGGGGSYHVGINGDAGGDVSIRWADSSTHDPYSSVDTQAYEVHIKGDIEQIGTAFMMYDATSADKGVGFTHNDNYGNSNIVFNHANGRPTKSTSACRIETSVDNATGEMMFEVGDNVTAGSPTALTECLRIRSNGVSSRVAFSKVSGSFMIDHPLESMSDSHYLFHSFIEGPQADLIYRGKVDLVDGGATVNIDSVSGMTDGTFEALNGNVQCFTTNEDGWTAVRGSVTENILTIEAQDATCTDTISWMVIGERKDPHMLENDWCDDNGRVITERTKVDVDGVKEEVE